MHLNNIKIKLCLSKPDNFSDYITKQICTILIVFKQKNTVKCVYCPVIGHAKILNNFLDVHQRKMT